MLDCCYCPTNPWDSVQFFSILFLWFKFSPFYLLSSSLLILSSLLSSHLYFQWYSLSYWVHPSTFSICYCIFWFYNFHLALFKISVSLSRCIFSFISKKSIINCRSIFLMVDCLFLFKLWFFWFLVCRVVFLLVSLIFCLSRYGFFNLI